MSQLNARSCNNRSGFVSRRGASAVLVATRPPRLCESNRAILANLTLDSRETDSVF